MLKSQSLKFTSMILQRTWKSNNQTLTQTADKHLCIWDQGSRIYERWPDGTEYSLELISREFKNNGRDIIEFTEILKELPSWETPSEICWKEIVPILSISPNNIKIPGWNITTTILAKPSTARNKT